MTPEASTTIIERDGQLEAVCAHVKDMAAIALDTEFLRDRTFFPRLGLIQLSTGSSHYLIDPLAIRDLDPLKDILLDQRVLKVLHACSEDVEVFYHLSGQVPWPIFDTQIAAAFVGYGYSIGYHGIVQELMQIQLPKDQTRSNWLRRPLTRSQITYAALDVAYLLPIYRMLSDKLERAGKASWAQEDFYRLRDVGRLQHSPDIAYLRISKAWNLDARALGVLQMLCAWREDEARSRNQPRRFIVSDDVLFEIATQQPRTVSDLKRIDSLPQREISKSGRSIVELVGEGLSRPDEFLPPPISAPLNLGEYTGTMRMLKRAVREKAKELDLPPELLANGKAIKALVRRVKVNGLSGVPPELEGWRQGAIGEELVALLEESG